MRKYITFVFVSLISFYGSFVYWFHSNQVNEYLSLTFYKPFVYRQLMPMLARVLTWTGVPASWAIVIVMTLVGVGFYYSFRALVYATNKKES